jgi:hypothetical protein
MDVHGHVPIELAVEHGNFPFVKRMIENCEKSGHLKTLVATIGMQKAIVSGKFAIFEYLLANGGEPLHPILRSDPDAPVQYRDYLDLGPWTPDLVYNQRKTNSLHLCVQAGKFGQRMCDALLHKLLPPSRWDVTPQTLRERDITNCCCDSAPKDDPIVDSRNERGETPFFCALKAEEYQLAWTLYEAGANKNVLIPNIVSGVSVELIPLVEHAVRWVSAHRAVSFLIRMCWGCLQLTGPLGDILRGMAIQSVSKWPLAEASELITYIQERAYPEHTWDTEVVYAIEVKNVAAVGHLLWKREKLLPGHQDPTILNSKVRETLQNAFRRFDGSSTDSIQECLRERALVTQQITDIIVMIRKAYDNQLGTLEFSSKFLEVSLRATGPEIQWRARRCRNGLIGVVKLEEELNQQLYPWLVCINMGDKSGRQDLIELFLEELKDMLRQVAWVSFDYGQFQLRLTAATTERRPKEVADVASPVGTGTDRVAQKAESQDLTSNASKSKRMLLLPKKFWKSQQ